MFDNKSPADVAQPFSSVYRAGKGVTSVLCRNTRSGVIAEQRSRSTAKVSTNQLTNSHPVLAEGLVSRPEGPAAVPASLTTSVRLL